MLLIHDGDVALRDFEEQDIPRKIEWINNAENNTYLHYDIPLEYDKTLHWFRNKNNATRLDCVIEYKGIPVGLIGLVSIDSGNQKAEYYVSMGNTAFKRCGIASNATRLLLKYAFECLQLNKIYLNVDSENIAACRLYEKAGFRCEGVFLQDMMHRGKLIDRKRYAMLASEFLNG